MGKAAAKAAKGVAAVVARGSTAAGEPSRLAAERETAIELTEMERVEAWLAAERDRVETEQIRGSSQALLPSAEADQGRWLQPTMCNAFDVKSTPHSVEICCTGTARSSSPGSLAAGNRRIISPRDAPPAPDDGSLRV